MGIYFGMKDSHVPLNKHKWLLNYMKLGLRSKIYCCPYNKKYLSRGLTEVLKPGIASKGNVIGKCVCFISVY